MTSSPGQIRSHFSYPPPAQGSPAPAPTSSIARTSLVQVCLSCTGEPQMGHGARSKGVELLHWLTPALLPTQPGIRWPPASLPEPGAPPLQAQQSPKHCSSAGSAGRASPWHLSPVLALPMALSHVSSARRRSARHCPSGQAAQSQPHTPARPQPQPSSKQQGGSCLVRQWGALRRGASHSPPPAPPAAWWVKARARSVPPYPPLSSRQTQTGS